MFKIKKINNISNYENLIVDHRDGYILIQHSSNKGFYNYRVYDENGSYILNFKSKVNALEMNKKDYLESPVKMYFDAAIETALEDELENASKEDDYYDLYDDDLDNKNYTKSKPWSYYYKEPKKSTGFLDKLNKSNTLVIHCADNSTDMLSQIYDGKGWDVLTDGNIDKKELHELIKSHNRIVCLGHGTPGGLINVQGSGYVVGDEEAPLLKDKKIFAIWCYATEYFKHNDIGHGQFITKNVPSEVWEAAAVGYHVSAQYILENITYWSKCCGDVIEQAFSGDVAGAVKKAQEAYQAKYGNDDNPDQKGVTDYNTDAIQVQP